MPRAILLLCYSCRGFQQFGSDLSFQAIALTYPITFISSLLKFPLDNLGIFLIFQFIPFWILLFSYIFFSLQKCLPPLKSCLTKYFLLFGLSASPFHSSDLHKLLNFMQLLKPMVYVWIKHLLKVTNGLFLETSRLGLISPIFRCWLYRYLFLTKVPSKLVETNNTFRVCFFSFILHASLRLRWFIHWFLVTVWTRFLLTRKGNRD